MNFFSVSPGYAIAFNDPNVVPTVFGFEDWGGFVTRNAIITGIGVSQQGNYQFLNTMRGFIYAYVFGDRMGEILLSGLAFQGNCLGGAFSGMDQIMNYYAQKRIANTGLPIGVAFGQAGFRGFLTGTGFNVTNPEAQIGQFVYRIENLPPNS